eukprot:COSAG06_NODE_17424_length_941_cov_46.616390_1_plen_165_part_10
MDGAPQLAEGETRGQRRHDLQHIKPCMRNNKKNNHDDEQTERTERTERAGVSATHTHKGLESNGWVPAKAGGGTADAVTDKWQADGSDTRQADGSDTWQADGSDTRQADGSDTWQADGSDTWQADETHCVTHRGGSCGTGSGDIHRALPPQTPCAQHSTVDRFIG